jgi:hypothetical protein
MVITKFTLERVITKEFKQVTPAQLEGNSGLARLIVVSAKVGWVGERKFRVNI